ncbi:DUF4832 domain-containing protein [Fibrobacterota bacterium]
MLLFAAAIQAQLQGIALQSSIENVQPMTGITFWTTSGYNTENFVQLEYAYMDFNDVVEGQGQYDWSGADGILDGVEGRGHSAIFRFRYVNPGSQTTVPDYIKDLPDYQEQQAQGDGRSTWYPDWSHEELQRFTLEFYSNMAERYDGDPRLAFVQVGFGLWGEYHAWDYDGDNFLGGAFPSLEYQEQFFFHLDSVFERLHFSVSIDSYSSSRSPIVENEEILNMAFGLFDDSFMQGAHEQNNATWWDALDHETRFLRAPHGGEFSYYAGEQPEVLNPDGGPNGKTFEESAEEHGISYMLGNAQPQYWPASRMVEAGLACGYKFRITAFRSGPGESLVEVTNEGVAPFYYDAHVAVNGTRAAESLKNLAPGESIICAVAAGGADPILTIESDWIVDGQTIEYAADLDGSETVAALPYPPAAFLADKKEVDVFLYSVQGDLVLSQRLSAREAEGFLDKHSLRKTGLSRGIYVPYIQASGKRFRLMPVAVVY